MLDVDFFFGAKALFTLVANANKATNGLGPIRTRELHGTLGAISSGTE